MISFSHTALERYSKCSELYRLWYLSDVPRPAEMSIELVTGIITHEILEEFYAVEKMTIPASEVWENYWKRQFVKFGVAPVYQVAVDYMTDVAKLKERSTADYQGEDAIRGKSGKKARNPKKTTAWKEESEKLGLEGRKAALDRIMAKKAIRWQTVSFTNAFVETWECLKDYTHPEVVKKITHVEFSLKGIRYPVADVALVGKIDLIGRFEDDGIIIVDHKSGDPKKATMLAAEYHDQLLSYGWAISQMFGEPPAYQALNMLRGGFAIVAPYDFQKAEETIERKEQVISAIKANVFIKQSPTEFGSNCYNQYSERACPFLPHCHKGFADKVLKA